MQQAWLSHYKRLDDYLTGKPLAVREYQNDLQAWRWLLHGKMFALLGEDKEKPPVLSLKCEPLLALSYRQQYPDIQPGYRLNKAHWNSVRLDGQVPEALLRQLADLSYELILNSLPKKLRQQAQQV